MDYVWKPLAETVFSFLAKYVRTTGTRCTSHVRKWEQAAAHLYYWACNFDHLYHFFLLYLEIAVLALSDSALVLPIFAEPLTVVTSKVSNSKPAMCINYQSHQKTLRIIKSERIWGNRPDRGTHREIQPVSRQSKFVARMATLRMASGKDAENCRFLFYYLLPPPLLPTVNVNISKVVEVKRANLYSCIQWYDSQVSKCRILFQIRAINLWFTVLFKGKPLEIVIVTLKSERKDKTRSDNKTKVNAFSTVVWTSQKFASCAASCRQFLQVAWTFCNLRAGIFVPGLPYLHFHCNDWTQVFQRSFTDSCVGPTKPKSTSHGLPVQFCGKDLSLLLVLLPVGNFCKLREQLYIFATCKLVFSLLSFLTYTFLAMIEYWVFKYPSEVVLVGVTFLQIHCNLINI